MRTITAVNGNTQRLDGGAMFGNAPKPLWTRWSTVDELNRIPLACRAMLIRDGELKILCETGVGVFFEPKMKERFGVVEDRHVLLDNLSTLGMSDEDVDIVILSHLHFDHAGGLLTAYKEGQPHGLLFPNARFLVGKEAWHRATNPHFRDRASFVPQLNKLLADSGRLELVEGDVSATLPKDYRFHFSHGHTPGLMLTEVPLAQGPVVFAGDLIPGRPWVHLPITMGYDRFPEQLIGEKDALLTDLLERGGRLFYTHDPEVALSGIQRDQRGRFSATDFVAAPVDQQ
ncbi:MAG: MBL fold metallo-hydrolase [Proteobacteria bacterium]|nr:MBL fold metallo-hydrolase [Pseudomonadota bacterium]